MTNHASLPPHRRHSRPRPPRAAFTLVELLVVIGIVAVLAALVTPAVMNARRTARIASIKLEIEMLDKALVNYKNEYGSFPPCNSTTGAGEPLAKHLQRLFPRCKVPEHLTDVGAGAITPANAIASWLLGYTNDPSRPLGPTPRQKLYDFDMGRLSGGAYAPSGLPNSPYVYIDKSNYGTVDTPNPFDGYQAQVQVLPSGASQFFNPDSFQILCAGLDGIFGNDDDLSNFWKGTRREYLDSLQTQ